MARKYIALYHHLAGWFPTWRQTAQPGVGDAPQFAFDTYALAPCSIIPGAVHTPNHPMPFSTPQIEHKQQYRLDGMAQQAGQILGQALYDPASANLTPLSK